MRTAGICCAAKRWRRRTRHGCKRSSKRPFASMECRKRSGRTMEHRLHRTAIAGLSRLAVWWMKLGIVPERIEAGHPEQNGRHERMHRTLKQEVAIRPAANGREQQRTMERFRQEYNQVRPHEALGDANASCGVCVVAAKISGTRAGAGISSRRCWYCRVRSQGQFRWKKSRCVFSEVLSGEPDWFVAGG